MFGFGTKFKETSLNTFGKAVADYLHSSGELVLIKNPVDGIPLVHEIEDDNSSYKQVRATTRLMFDCGVIWSLAYVILRDEEYKNLEESKALLKTEKSINQFLKEGLKYVSKHDYVLPKIYNHQTIINFELDSRTGDSNIPFNKGTGFSGTFLEDFYNVRFKN